MPGQERIAYSKQSGMNFPENDLDEVDGSNIEDNGDPDELDAISDSSGENNSATVIHHGKRMTIVSSTSPTPTISRIQASPVPRRSSPRRKANPPPRTLSYTAASSPSRKEKRTAGLKDHISARQRSGTRQSLSLRRDSSPRHPYNHDALFSNGPLRNIPSQHHRDGHEILLRSLPRSISPDRLRHDLNQIFLNMPDRNPVYNFGNPTAGPSHSPNIGTTNATPLTKDLNLCPITVHVNTAANIPDLEYMSYYKQLQLERRQREQESHVYAYINNYAMERLDRAEKRIAELEERLDDSYE